MSGSDLAGRVQALEDEFRFWRNFAALWPYVLRRPPVVIPAQRAPLEDQRDVMVRRGFNARPDASKRAR